MSTTGPSPERKSLDYAESLGVNSVYKEVLESRRQLDATLNELSTLRDHRRMLETKRNDIEMEVAEEEQGRHDMSATAMKEHLKIAYHKHSGLAKIRMDLLDVTNNIEGLEYDKSMLEIDIKIAVARLHELSGYLQFMAVIKQAGLARAANKTRAEGNPW